MRVLPVVSLSCWRAEKAMSVAQDANHPTQPAADDVPTTIHYALDGTAYLFDTGGSAQRYEEIMTLIERVEDFGGLEQTIAVHLLVKAAGGVGNGVHIASFTRRARKRCTSERS